MPPKEPKAKEPKAKKPKEMSAVAEISTLVYQTKIAEQAERWEDMVGFLEQLITRKKALDLDEQKMFAIACKNCVGRLRTAWRVANAARARYVESDNKKEQMAAEYVEEIGLEILKWCDRVHADLKALAGSEKEPEQKVLSAKMEADYYRYRCEIKPDELQRASDAFQRATLLASALSAANPVRMGLALNYSVFKYELENHTEEACSMAVETLTNARGDGIANNRDAFLIEQLLQDNLSLWRSEQMLDKGQTSL